MKEEVKREIHVSVTLQFAALRCIALRCCTVGAMEVEEEVKREVHVRAAVLWNATQ